MNLSRTLLNMSLATGAIFVLCDCSNVPVSPAKAASTRSISPTNVLPNFYKVNPALAERPATYKASDALYLLVDWNGVYEIQAGYINKGYVILGHCDFSGPSGMPLREDAIEFGRYLGADLIIYAVQQTAAGQLEHYISYLARS